MAFRTSRREEPKERSGRASGRSGPSFFFFVFILGVIALAAACAAAPTGPPFEPAPPPSPDRGRIYLYRIDERESLASVRVAIDGDPLGRLHDREYTTLELPPGSHELRVGLRGFGWLAWGWNEHRFRLAPGETHYIKLSVRLSSSPVARSRELEIAGREAGRASENVFIILPSEREALAELATTRRIDGSPDRDPD